MADELKPCPFCGGKAIPPNERDHHVSCSKCRATSGNWAEYCSAIEAWNTRYERTCHLEQIPYSPGEYEGMRCSLCKTPDPDMGYGSYCAGCGAKVVDDDQL